MSAPALGSLFSGYRGLDMAVEALTGAKTVWCSDIDPGANAILAHHWPCVPNLGDISRIPFGDVPPVDILTGGFPCQDVSAAGKRAGLVRYGDKNRSGLWAEMARAVDTLRPQLVVAENVRGLLSAKTDTDPDLFDCLTCMADATAEPMRALGAVVGDLAAIGYDAAWQGVRASDSGFCHQRFRVFVIAWPANTDRQGLAQWGQQPARDERATAERSGVDAAGLKLLPNLRTAVMQLLPTPNTGVSPNSHGRRGGRASNGHQSGADLEALAKSLGTDWGIYEPAIRRQEAITGPAPAPTDLGPKGGRRLDPRFSEWMMGLPAGHVTGVPGISARPSGARNAQLKAIGNGVVPQQAMAAISHLLAAVTVAA